MQKCKILLGVLSHFKTFPNSDNLESTQSTKKVAIQTSPDWHDDFPHFFLGLSFTKRIQLIYCVVCKYNDHLIKMKHSQWILRVNWLLLQKNPHPPPDVSSCLLQQTTRNLWAICSTSVLLESQPLGQNYRHATQEIIDAQWVKWIPLIKTDTCN